MRPSWSEYFFELARTVATRATCPRKSVGCVLVVDRRVVASGYNGSPPGRAHCTEPDYGCLLERADGVDHCVRTIHAEANAIAWAARAGVSVEGATCYVTVKPCWTCHRLLLAAGILDVRWLEDYGAAYPTDPPPERSQALFPDADSMPDGS